jgi:hypothetical protein
MKLVGLAAAVLAALSFGIAAAAGAFDRGSHVLAVQGGTPPPPDETELAAIRQLVLRAAAAMGDHAPTDGVVVPTTRRLAELVDVDTAEPDTPVYFVLVHGEFTASDVSVQPGAKAPTGTILTLTIDPTTNESLDTGLVAAMPDVNAMGEPEPLRLSTGLAALTKSVPCANGHQRLAGAQAVSRFHAVTAVSCVEGTRIYPGHGEWEVEIRRIAVSSVADLQRYFEQPDRPNLPQGGFCDDVLHAVLVPTFVDGRGRWLVPRTPVDGCHEPLAGHGTLARAVRWHVVSVRKVRLLVSAAALTAHCAMSVKNEAAGAAGQLGPSAGGPLFAVTPRTVNVCIYRTGDAFQVGDFVRGFRLDVTRTRRLLGALTGAAPSGSCPDQRLFAVVRAKLAAEVELGGCRRVSRPNLGGLGRADAAGVRAILSAR